MSVEPSPQALIRPYADNVVLVLEPLQRETASGLTIVHTKVKHRTARVVASGPGYYNGQIRYVMLRDELGRFTGVESVRVFIPNETKPGMRVIVDALAGQNYAMDLTVPRHNKTSEFEELFGERGEFRIVREQEILGVIEEC